MNPEHKEEWVLNPAWEEAGKRGITIWLADPKRSSVEEILFDKHFPVDCCKIVTPRRVDVDEISRVAQAADANGPDTKNKLMTREN